MSARAPTAQPWVLRMFLVVLAAVGAFTVAAPSVASAHAVLRYSAPAASSVLAEPPGAIELGFNEAVNADLSEIRLFDARQREIGIGRTEHGAAGPAVVTADIPALKEGQYVVVWRVTSADGHPVSGAFPFEIGTTATGNGAALVDKVVESAQRRSPLGPALSAGKFLAFLGFVLLAGVVLFCSGTPMLQSHRTTVVSLCGMVLVLLGSLCVLLLQGAHVTGRGWGDVGRWDLVNEVMGTRVGAAVIARIVLVVLWLALVQVQRRPTGNPVTAVPVWLLTVLTALTFSASGHPSAGTLPVVFVAVDVAHLLGIAVWVGGLFSVLLLRNAIDSNPPVAPAVSRFSRHATWAMPLVVLTGTAQALHLSDGVSSLGGTAHGRFVIAKFALVAVTVVLGTRARRVLAVRGARGIVPLVRVEAVIAVVVLALSAALVSTSPNAADRGVSVFSASLAQNDLIAEVTITPARVGSSEIHALFTPPGGAITPVKDVKVRMELPSGQVPAVPVEMIQIGANHWSGVVQFPYPGKWTVEILVTPQDNAQVRFSTVARIDG